MLLSRRGATITPRYPEIHARGRALGATEVILDGEIVALDDKGRPSFEEIQQRMGLTSETEIRRKMKEVPVPLMVFDLMWQDRAPPAGPGHPGARTAPSRAHPRGLAQRTRPHPGGGGR